MIFSQRKPESLKLTFLLFSLELGLLSDSKKNESLPYPIIGLPPM